MADSDDKLGVKLASFSALIFALSEAKNAFLINEFERVIKVENVMPHAEEAMPYIFAGALLSLTGREINQDNVSKLMAAVGIKANKALVKDLYAANLRSHIPYINAYYFLLAIGKLGTEQEILKVIEALGLEPDKSRLEDVIAFLYAPRPPQAQQE